MDRKKLLAGAAAAIVLTVGGATAIAAGQQSQDTGTRDAQEEHDPAIKGTIPAPEAKSEQNDAEEAKQLEGLSKIDKAAAEKAALDAAPGQVKKTELGDEDGFVVYEIEVLGQDGKATELKVDAGDGTILAHETEDNNDQGDAGDDDADNGSPDTPK